jgi:hypothetical protein
LVVIGFASVCYGEEQYRGDGKLLRLEGNSTFPIVSYIIDFGIIDLGYKNEKTFLISGAPTKGYRFSIMVDCEEIRDKKIHSAIMRMELRADTSEILFIGEGRLDSMFWGRNPNPKKDFLIDCFGDYRESKAYIYAEQDYYLTISVLKPSEISARAKVFAESLFP